jgi:hypothetical protein
MAQHRFINAPDTSKQMFGLADVVFLPNVDLTFYAHEV